MQRSHPPAPVLDVDHLVKAYGRHTAVDDVSLQVRAGEVVAFLGPNGAGKTTTLKIIAGLLQPSAGAVRIEGRSVAAEPEAARTSLGFIPDRPFVYERLTALEFMAFVADLYRLPRETAREDALRWLGRLGLADFAGERIEQYSHGMKQRLVMAAAFFRRPKLLVIDEPMVGLDPRGARIVKGVFREAADAGAAVLLSTHSLAVAQEICDRAVIIHKGKIVAAGDLGSLRAQSGLTNAALEDVFLVLTETEHAESVR